jgi:hypothetical protein
MYADVLTRPLHGAQFTYERECLTGWMAHCQAFQLVRKLRSMQWPSQYIRIHGVSRDRHRAPIRMFSKCSPWSSESDNTNYSALLDDFAMILCIIDVMILIMIMKTLGAGKEVLCRTL